MREVLSLSLSLVEVQQWAWSASDFHLKSTSLSNSHTRSKNNHTHTHTHTHTFTSVPNFPSVGFMDGAFKEITHFNMAGHVGADVGSAGNYSRFFLS